MLNKMLNCARRLTIDDIHALEESIGRKLPENYVQFLLQYNGGLPAPDAFPIEGMPNNPMGSFKSFSGLTAPSNQAIWMITIIR